MERESVSDHALFVIYFRQAIGSIIRVYEVYLINQEHVFTFESQ